MKRSLKILATALLATSLGCTPPAETTGIAAATGGAIGAGLGAIVGSQSGDAGSGLVIGAVAGSATGALVGNALQAQDEAIRTQDEAIERQERRILAQRSEIEELRKLNTDHTKGKIRSYTKSKPIPEGPKASLKVSQIKPYLPKLGPNVIEKQVIERKIPTRSEPTVEGEGCNEAGREFTQAKSSAETADKLFHLRRALRLCPDDSRFHAELGKVYLKTGREDDARYEFREALKLNPENSDANSGMRRLE